MDAIKKTAARILAGVPLHELTQEELDGFVTMLKKEQKNRIRAILRWKLRKNPFVF